MDCLELPALVDRLAPAAYPSVAAVEPFHVVLGAPGAPATGQLPGSIPIRDVLMPSDAQTATTETIDPS